VQIPNNPCHKSRNNLQQIYTRQRHGSRQSWITCYFLNSIFILLYHLTHQSFGAFFIVQNTLHLNYNQLIMQNLKQQHHSHCLNKVSLQRNSSSKSKATGQELFLHNELKLFLYLAVLSFTTGIGILIYQNITDWSRSYFNNFM
jgi:hypothetical protein